MKKLVFTLALGIFFVTFSNAQTADVKASEEKQAVELKASSDEKVACEPGCTKECCADKKATKEECKEGDAKKKVTKASLRPSSCADKKKTSCASKKTSCATKKTSCKEKK